MEIREISLSEWGDAALRNSGEVFHAPEALSVIDDHVDGELRLFGGFKGQQPVALLPVFETDRALGRTVFSPPLDLGIPRLGMIISPQSPKQYKRERINKRFTEELIDHLDLHDRWTFFRAVCPVGFSDPRPFEWNDFACLSEFTYVIDLSHDDIEGVMAPFSRSLRKEMRRIDEVGLTIETEGVDAALQVYDHVVERYDSQGESAPMTREFVQDLVNTLDDDRCRVYVARTPNGEYLSGIIALFSADLAYYWQGGVQAYYESVSVNNLIHRRVIEDVLNDPALETVTGYDLVGANTERLCEYKAKFGGELVPYYILESSGPEMEMAKKAYNLLAGSVAKE